MGRNSKKNNALNEEQRRARERQIEEEQARQRKDRSPRNPPYTTKHGITAPKFGSAGSGGAENEPGPER